MKILCNIFKIPCIIYIDDTIIFARQENLQLYLAATILLYTIPGYWLSHEKIEAHSTVQRTLTVLGLNYSVEKRGVLVEAPEMKLLKTKMMLESLLSAFIQAKAEPN